MRFNRLLDCWGRGPLSSVEAAGAFCYVGVRGNLSIIALLVVGDAPRFPARFVSIRGLGVQLCIAQLRHGTNHLYESASFSTLLICSSLGSRCEPGIFDSLIILVLNMLLDGTK